MELMAALQTLRSVPSGSKVHLYFDSDYFVWNNMPCNPMEAAGMA